jgi:hypothetical protein
VIIGFLLLFAFVYWIGNDHSGDLYEGMTDQQIDQMEHDRLYEYNQYQNPDPNMEYGR